MEKASKAAVVLLSTGLLAGSALAHEDRVFELGADGTIGGVPEDYSPARLIVGPPDEKRSDVYPPPPTVTLELSGVETRLAPCVAQLFRLPPGESVSLHGSWYHDFSLLPPYLVVSLPSHTYSSGWFTGYTLLFDLRDASLVEMHAVIVTPGAGEATHGLPAGSTSRRIPAHEAICETRLGPDLVLEAPEPCGWFRRITSGCS